MVRRVAIAWLSLTLLLAPAAAAQSGDDTGWEIVKFHAEVVILPDSSIQVVETIDADFGPLERHGIIRTIPLAYEYDAEHLRLYRFELGEVTDPRGRPIRAVREGDEHTAVIRIGHPDITVSGRQIYRIGYRIEGALNPLPGRDELYWNVNGGDWPVPTVSVSATVRLAGAGELGEAACFQGRAGSGDPCAAAAPAADRRDFRTTRALLPGEQLTFAVALPKGTVAEPPLLLVDRPAGPEDMFAINAWTVLASSVIFLGGAALVGRAWWTTGRDRRFVARSLAEDGGATGARPLLWRDTIVAEYEPPEGLRPAEVGLLIDESADTKDVTATIVDLAVRGHLTITDAPARGLFGRGDWTLERTVGRDDLAEYERIIRDGLFEDGETVKVSELKNEFHRTLAKAQKALYREAVRRRHFRRDPARVRTVWGTAGILIAIGGFWLIPLLGIVVGAGLVGLAILAVGLLLFAVHRAMPARTAAGSELTRRVLGFRRYMETAEAERQRFAERERIFSAYLPYAIVFGIVERWAAAFRDIDAVAATRGWYAGAGGFDAPALSSRLSGFSSTVSGAIASTPGGSGGSGFSGGSAGGGGGGGGGGSW